MRLIRQIPRKIYDLAIKGLGGRRHGCESDGESSVTAGLVELDIEEGVERM
jgi:hypothetical protein